jgi:hypothetical protein
MVNATARVAVQKFAALGSSTGSELLNQSHTSKAYLLVPLFDLKVLTELPQLM